MKQDFSTFPSLPCGAIWGSVFPQPAWVTQADKVYIAYPQKGLTYFSQVSGRWVSETPKLGLGCLEAMA